VPPLPTGKGIPFRILGTEYFTVAFSFPPVSANFFAPFFAVHPLFFFGATYGVFPPFPITGDTLTECKNRFRLCTLRDVFFIDSVVSDLPQLKAFFLRSFFPHMGKKDRSMSSVTIAPSFPVASLHMRSVTSLIPFQILRSSSSSKQSTQVRVRIDRAPFPVFFSSLSSPFPLTRGRPLPPFYGPSYLAGRRTSSVFSNRITAPSTPPPVVVLPFFFGARNGVPCLNLLDAVQASRSC